MDGESPIFNLFQIKGLISSRDAEKCQWKSYVSGLKKKNAARSITWLARNEVEKIDNLQAKKKIVAASISTSSSSSSSTSRQNSNHHINEHKTLASHMRMSKVFSDEEDESKKTSMCKKLFREPAEQISNIKESKKRSHENKGYSSTSKSEIIKTPSFSSIEVTSPFQLPENQEYYMSMSKQTSARSDRNEVETQWIHEAKDEKTKRRRIMDNINWDEI
ncbi:unnamed protein product [Amoebophrya sp. A25]|nr:unnamed protein product [Amoebophrya sp. A25]|eukprot:GSA25T00027000001.1